MIQGTAQSRNEIEVAIDANVSGLLNHYSTAEHPIGIAQIVGAVRAAAAIGGCHECQIGVRVAGDAAIHEINRRFLQHDYPTDVISFPYDFQPPFVEGELVVSIDTAAREAAEAGWSIAQELLLYVIHGTLHLVGYDDVNEAQKIQMRAAEQRAMLMRVES